MSYEKFVNLNDEKHSRIIKLVAVMDRAKFNKPALKLRGGLPSHPAVAWEIKQITSGGPNDCLGMLEKRLFFVLYY
jgi:hypothetical protein